MNITDLRPGLLVQQNGTITSGARETRNGSFSLLFQISSVHANHVTCQWLFTRMRGGEAHFPSRTAVYTFTADEVSARLQPADQPLIDHYRAALDACKVVG